MYIPDLFGAYIKGREYAIDRNWNDLKQYEAIEAARNMNDQTALDLLRQRNQFGGEAAIFQHNVDASAKAAEISDYAQPGMVATADTRALAAQDARSTFLNNRDAYQQALDLATQATLGGRSNAATAQIAANSWLAPNAAQLGQWNAQVGYNTANANAITSAHQPLRATTNNALWEADAALGRIGQAKQYADAQFSFSLLPTQQDTTRRYVMAENAAAVDAPRAQIRLQQQQELQRINELRALYLDLMQTYERTQSPATLAEAQRVADLLAQMQGALTAQTTGVPLMMKSAQNPAPVQPTAATLVPTQPVVATPAPTQPVVDQPVPYGLGNAMLPGSSF